MKYYKRSISLFMMITIINTYANTIWTPKISQQLFNEHDIKYEI